jgi:tetratricopeptide (TPR) repeat protein
VLALGLTSVDNLIIRTAIAVAITIAFLVIAGWLPLAWLHRRRAQVVIEDVAAVEGIPQSATSGLSAQLRQAVWRLLLREKERGDASYAVLTTLKQDIDDGLLRAHGHVQIRTVAAELRSSTEDSLAALTAGVRAVAPAQAEGLVAALGAILPPQRGWVVRAFPVLRGEGRDADVALTLELAQFDHAPDAVTSFEASSETLRDAGSEAAQAAAMRALLHRLLEPAARWIETRLVAQQLAQSGVPISWRLLNRRKRRQELVGLQMQLAGQMSLYAATQQEAFYRGFAEQALADLAKAARQLPTYFRPHSTAAAVHERLGWGYRRGHDSDRAANEFERAVQLYDTAAELLAAAPGAAPEPRAAALDRVKVRRAKCRLLSGERSHTEIARRELAELLCITGSTAHELYNCACLFAVAMSCLDGSEEAHLTYGPRAWHLLGQALLAEGAAGPWIDVMTDVELDALEQQKRRDFCTELKARHPELTPLDAEAAHVVVKHAMYAIGVEPPSYP